MGIGLPVAKFLDISPSPPAPLPAGEGREPANPLPSQREMALEVMPSDPQHLRLTRVNRERLSPGFRAVTPSCRLGPATGGVDVD